MLISIIFIVIWCLLIMSNIITLIELYKIKRRLNKSNGRKFAKTMGIKEKLEDANVVNVGLSNKNKTSDTEAQ